VVASILRSLRDSTAPGGTTVFDPILMFSVRPTAWLCATQCRVLKWSYATIPNVPGSEYHQSTVLRALVDGGGLTPQLAP